MGGWVGVEGEAGTGRERQGQGGRGRDREGQGGSEGGGCKDVRIRGVYAPKPSEPHHHYPTARSSV